MTRRTWTCATCRIEHTCTLSVVSSSDHSSHHMAQGRSHLSFHLHPIHAHVWLSLSVSLLRLLLLAVPLPLPFPDDRRWLHDNQQPARLRKRDLRHPGRLPPPHRQRGQYLCWGNRASPTGTGHDEDRQRSHSYSESSTDADFRQNSRNSRIISASPIHLVTVAWQISSESLRESTNKLTSTSTNHLDRSGQRGIVPHAENDHESIHWVTKDDMSVENRLQLASYAASATNDGVISDDYHGMWGCVHLQYIGVIVSELKRITSSNERWIRGGVWGIMLHNPWLTHHSHLFSTVSVYSLLPFSAPITCAITMTALMHLHGSSHTEKGHLLYTCALDIIKCLSFLTTVEVGQYFMTKDTEEFSQFTDSVTCRE